MTDKNIYHCPRLFKRNRVSIDKWAAGVISALQMDSGHGVEKIVNYDTFNTLMFTRLVITLLQNDLNQRYIAEWMMVMI